MDERQIEKKFEKRFLYYFVQITGWFLYGFIALLVSLSQNKPLNIKLLSGIFAIVVIGILTTEILHLKILKNKWILIKPVLLLKKIIPFSLLLSLTAYILQTIWMLLMGSTFQFHPLDAVLGMINWWILISIWVVLYYLYNYVNRWQNEALLESRLEAAKAQAELNQLKNQINPHFIFNSLNSIRALIDESPENAKLSVTLLASLIRKTLSVGQKDFISIKEELEIVESYLKIEKIRFENRLSFEIVMHEDVANCLIPPLIIQTLTENSIKHGISKLKNGGKVLIECKPVNEQLKITIQNDTPANTYQKIQDIQTSNTGLGLKLTYKRLELLYSNNFILEIYAKDNRFTVNIFIPCNIQNYKL